MIFVLFGFPDEFTNIRDCILQKYITFANNYEKKNRVLKSFKQLGI